MIGHTVSIAAQIIAQAESYTGIRAGIVRLEDVLKGPSYKVFRTCAWRVGQSTEAVEKWIEEGRSVLVLGLNHPADTPRLDWFARGNTLGNRNLMEIVDALMQWLLSVYELNAQRLPYFLEKGGVFLKDAAALAGLGVMGRNNLLINPEWGPRIRLRAMLIGADMPPSRPVEDFSPCGVCDEVCRKSCPAKAFLNGNYDWSACLSQLNLDKDNRVSTDELDRDGNPVSVVKWCRECELACPVGG